MQNRLILTELFARIYSRFASGDVSELSVEQIGVFARAFIKTAKAHAPHIELDPVVLVELKKEPISNLVGNLNAVVFKPSVTMDPYQVLLHADHKKAITGSAGFQIFFAENGQSMVATFHKGSPLAITIDQIDKPTVMRDHVIAAYTKYAVGIRVKGGSFVRDELRVTCDRRGGGKIDVSIMINPALYEKFNTTVKIVPGETVWCALDQFVRNNCADAITGFKQEPLIMSIAGTSAYCGYSNICDFAYTVLSPESALELLRAVREHTSLDIGFAKCSQDPFFVTCISSPLPTVRHSVIAKASGSFRAIPHVTGVHYFGVTGKETGNLMVKAFIKHSRAEKKPVYLYDLVRRPQLVFEENSYMVQQCDINSAPARTSSREVDPAPKAELCTIPKCECHKIHAAGALVVLDTSNSSLTNMNKINIEFADRCLVAGAAAVVVKLNFFGADVKIQREAYLIGYGRPHNGEFFICMTREIKPLYYTFTLVPGMAERVKAGNVTRGSCIAHIVVEDNTYCPIKKVVGNYRSAAKAVDVPVFTRVEKAEELIPGGLFNFTDPTKLAGVEKVGAIANPLEHRGFKDETVDLKDINRACDAQSAAYDYEQESYFDAADQFALLTSDDDDDVEGALLVEPAPDDDDDAANNIRHYGDDTIEIVSQGDPPADVGEEEVPPLIEPSYWFPEGARGPASNAPWSGNVAKLPAHKIIWPGATSISKPIGANIAYIGLSRDGMPMYLFYTDKRKAWVGWNGAIGGYHVTYPSGHAHNIQQAYTVYDYETGIVLHQTQYPKQMLRDLFHRLTVTCVPQYIVFNAAPDKTITASRHALGTCTGYVLVKTSVDAAGW